MIQGSTWGPLGFRRDVVVHRQKRMSYLMLGNKHVSHAKNSACLASW